MLRFSISRYVKVSAAVGCVAATGTYATEPDAYVQTASNSANETKLEVVTVTARRREETAQAVPVAVTVLSQQTLQDNNVQTVADLQYLAPSLSANPDSNGGYTRDSLNLTIRGQGISGLSALPAVVGYLNEVPLPTDSFGAFVGGPGTLFDLDGVQVLKGPQGTLFGRNTMGGALLLTTARPKDEFGGRIQVGYGNYNDREIDGAVDLPIASDVLLTRIAFNGQKRDGFTQVLGTPDHPNGTDVDKRDNWSVRGTVSFHPSDRFQNDTIATYQSYDSNGSPAFLYAVNPNHAVPTLLFPSLPALLAEQQQLGRRTHVAESDNLAGSGYSLVLNNISSVDLAQNLSLRNIAGYVRAGTDVGFEWDGTVLPILDIIVPPYRQVQKQYTEEVQLQGRSFSEKLDWTVGGFYLDDEPDGLIAGRQLIFATNFLSLTQRGSKSTAAYAHGIYDLSWMHEGLEVAGGVRYTWDSRSFDSVTYAPNCIDPATCLGTPASQPSRSHALTWDLALNYRMTPETMLYLTSRRGYRAGGANGVQSGVDLPEYGPEYVTDVELGVKSDWQAGSVPIRTNVDVYRQNYTDIQVTENIPDTRAPLGFFGETVNGSKARIWGAELETQAQLTRDFRFGVNFDWLDLEYTNFDADVPDSQIASFLATRTVGRPRFKYDVNAVYRLPLDSRVGDLAARANWSWQARNGDTSAPYGVIDAYGLLNVSLDWNDIAGSKLGASFFMSNALNKDYIVTNLPGYSVFGFVSVRYGEPRFYGIRLKYSFGGEAK